MKKKMLSVLLVLCMISALAGCGNAEDSGNKPAGNEQEDTGGTQEITKVGIGVTPYPMYAGLWFDTWMTTTDFLENNQETAIKLQALIFGAVNAFDADQDKFSEVAARLFTETSGTETPAEEWKTFMTEFDDLVSVDEAKEGFYNPDSDRYWEKTVNYTVKTLIESGDLPEGTDGKQYYTAGEELFQKLLEDQELVEKIQNTVLP